MKPTIKDKALRIAAAAAKKDSATIATETGLTQRSVERLMTKGGKARLATVGRLAEVLGVSVEDIAEF